MVKLPREHFLFRHFLLIWEEKICGPVRENFLPGFPSSLFSLVCQTVENTVFHSIFLPMFSILPKFTQTKHNVKDIICLFFSFFFFFLVFFFWVKQRIILLRASTTGNSITSYFIILKNHFINYTIQFYNAPNISTFIFIFYSLK